MLDEHTITDDDIRALREDADRAGNHRRVTLCDLALGTNPIGRPNCRRECARILNEERNPPPHIPAGAHTPADVLRLARELRVPGRLIKTSKRYEWRSYAGHLRGNPWVIIAQREQHYTGEGA